MTKLPESFFFANTNMAGVAKANEFLCEVFGSSHNYLEPKIEIVGPDEAEKILSLNQKNRNLKKHHVAWLAKQMELDLWIYTGQVIALDIECHLVNLQHTLHASIKAGKSYPYIVTCGLSEKAIHVMDTGVARTAGDVLSMNGYPSGNKIAAIVRKIINYESGLKSLYIGGLSQSGANNSSSSGSSKMNLADNELITNMKVLDIVKSDESYWIELMRQSQIFYNNYKAVSSSFYGFLYHFFFQRNPDQAWEFMSKLSTGVGIRMNSPIHALRQKLEKEIFAKTDHTAKEKLYWFIYCWNKFRNGEDVKVINKYDPKKEFPEIE